jgi:alkanesulfonate monooxygenase SsuD/methylene tetrahydromethanopterin reductase-like flavin-dependent oxidoreductase (luciferase family)
MKIGISLPESLLDPDIIQEWAHRVDNGPFSTLSVLDRVVYSNPSPLITLTLAAAASRRVRLMTEVLLSPLHDPTLLAKDAATLDVFSRGRFTLGLGVGIREDDFIATSATNYKRRGKYMEEQITTMKHIWSGESWSENIGPVGPVPVQSKGPEIILGGISEVAFRRVARFADGTVSGFNDPVQIDQHFRTVEQAWQEAARPGKPRLISQVDIGLDSPNDDKMVDRILAYYKISPPYDTYKASTLVRTERQLRDSLKAIEQVGADEVVLFTWSTDINQIERIADIIG